MKELTGRIFNVQKYSIYDGDGIRTLIFFKGCNINCDWCSNPEGINPNFQVMLNKEQCIACGKCSEVCNKGVHLMSKDESGTPIHQIDRSALCDGCKECEKICLGRAISIVGSDVTVSELMQTIMEDYDFYLASGGGVTLGGGELTLQIEFVESLLKRCKEKMINTAVETNGMTKMSGYERLVPYTDLFLFDIKNIDDVQHENLFGIKIDRVKRNLERLVELGANVIIRMPLIRGYNDDFGLLTRTFDYIRSISLNGEIKRVDILPYHQYGKSKYQKLDMIYPIKSNIEYDANELGVFERFFSSFDISINLVKH